jgi:Holliday junction resolvasome RuvABC DNA-binding subunit
MYGKREAARRTAEREQAHAKAKADAELELAGAEQEQTKADRERTRDVIAALRTLGYPATRACDLAGRSNAPGLDLEQHVRAALRLIVRPRRAA